MAEILSIVSASVNLMDALYQKLIEIDLTEDGYTADIFLYYEAGTILPGVGRRFTVTLPSGLSLLFVQKSIPKVVKEVYDDINNPAMFVYKCHCVDPITYIENQPPPNICPLVNTKTGLIFKALLALYDPSLNLSGIADGNTIASFNFKEFSSFGDIRRSEIVSGGYRLRMGAGTSVEGNFDSSFSAGDYRVDYTDFRYTPKNQDVEPPDEILGSVTVIPNKEVPTHVNIQFSEQDLRVMSSLALAEKPFGLEDSEPLKLGAGIDLTDTDTFDTSGVTTTGSYLIFSDGRLILREARPYRFPFITVFSGIILEAEDASFRFGFASGCESVSELIVVTSSDFSGASIPLAVDTPFDQHRYAAYFMPQADGTIKVWGLYKRQNFNVDEDQIIAQIDSINLAAVEITLNAPWTIGTDFIRVLHSGTDVDSAAILHRSEDGLTLRLDHNLVGAVVGDDVTRGVQEETKTMIRLLKTVSAGAGYGLPYLAGNHVALEGMTVQRIPQIAGRLIFETQTNPDSDYPRDLLLNVDLTEFSDGQVSGSGSSAQVTWDTKFSSEPQAWFTFAYVVGGKDRYESVCGAGAHATVPIDLEQDPAKLQAIADQICAVGSTPYPRVNASIHMSQVDGTPLPGDLLPVKLPAEYNIGDQEIPIQSVKLVYKGALVTADDEYNQDEILYQIVAGPKSPVDRVKQRLLQTTTLTKYPLRVVSLAGASISNPFWNDETGVFTADVSGGTVHGPRGEVLDLAAGVRPSDLAGVKDPAAAPVTFRCKIPTARKVADQLIVQVIYKPNAIDPTSVVYKWHNQERRIEFDWQPASGAKKYNIFKRIAGHSGDTDADLELVDTVVAPGVSWSGAISKDGDTNNDRTIWVQSVGLCDKVSSKVKLVATLPQLAAPTTFQLVKKMKASGRLVVLLSAPPAGADLGRTTGLKVFARRSTDGTDYTHRVDFVDNVEGTHIEVLPLISETEATRYVFFFTDFEQGDEVWIGCAWVDQFGDEGVFKSGFDAMHPPFEVGSISTASFFRSPNPASPLTNQAASGTYIDDDDTTNKIENSAIHRVNFGIHTTAFMVLYERSTKTKDDSVGDWPTGGKSHFHSPVIKLTDSEILAGFKDFLMHQRFVWARKKHWTIRPIEVIFFGIGTHEVDVDGEKSFAENVRFLLGYDGDPTGQPIVAWETDAYFNKQDFQFKPWKTGVDHGYYKVQDVRAKPKPAVLRERWEPIDDANFWRFIAIISADNFGTKGPGADAAMVTDLDHILEAVSEGGLGGEGAITLWDQTNTTKTISAYAINVDKLTQFNWEVGTTYGPFTIDSSSNFWVGALAQNKAGRYSDEISDTDSDTGGLPPGDTGTAIWSDDCATQRLDPCTAEGITAIHLRLKAPLDGGIRIIMNRPQSVKAS